MCILYFLFIFIIIFCLFSKCEITKTKCEVVTKHVPFGMADNAVSNHSGIWQMGLEPVRRCVWTPKFHSWDFFSLDRNLRKNSYMEKGVSTSIMYNNREKVSDRHTQC